MQPGASAPGLYGVNSRKENEINGSNNCYVTCVGAEDRYPPVLVEF